MGGLRLADSHAAASQVSAPGFTANRLLAALPSSDLERWRSDLEWTAMPLGQVLYCADRKLSQVFNLPC